MSFKCKNSMGGNNPFAVEGRLRSRPKTSIGRSMADIKTPVSRNSLTFEFIQP
jgi:hypothetical protein